MLESYILNPFQCMPIRGWVFWILWIVGCVLWSGARWKHGKKNLFLTILVVYLGFVFGVTVVGRNKVDVVPYELVPFWSWKAAVVEVIETGNSWVGWQIMLNIVLFIPIGVLAYGVKVSRFRKMVLWCIGFSLFIEILQLVFCIGLFEWDDILHNTLGYTVGFGMGYLLKSLSFRKTQQEE